MTEQKYTDEQFIAAMQKAVEIRGEDYVYPARSTHPEYWVNMYLDNTDSSDNLSCRYQLEDSTPACIVGLALHEIDPDLVPPATNTGGALSVLRKRYFSEEIQRAADAAQGVQDDGLTWGEALDTFNSEYAVQKARA